MMLKKAFKLFFQNKLLVLLLIVGTVLWSLTMVKSGLCLEKGCQTGIGFWGPNGHDAIWHISLSESLGRATLEMPVFAGEKIKNYHLGFDYLLSFLNKETTLSTSLLYFQVLPPIFAFLIGLLTYQLVYLWKKSKEAALWTTFFVYFGGGFGWIVTLLRDGQINGESLFWAQGSFSTLINPPYGLSLTLILTGLILLFKFKEKPSLINGLLIVVSFGVLAQIKVYAAILVLAALLAVCVYEYFKNKNLKLFFVFIGVLVLTLFLTFSFNKNIGSILVFKPFWFLETMVGTVDRFYWPRFYSAMTTYKMGNIWLKLIPAYFLAFTIFLIGNLGTRVLAFFELVKLGKNFKKLSFLDVFIITVVNLGLIIPLFFIQKGTSWNTIQFFYYSLFFLSFYAGIFVSEQKNKITKLLLPLIVLLMVIPTTIATLRHFLPSRPPAKITASEIEALTFLKSQADGVVLTYPYDAKKAKESEINPPRPLYLYESTAYVSAYSGKISFLEDEVNLDITGYDWKQRRALVEEFFAQSCNCTKNSFLTTNNISYLYLVKGQNPAFESGKPGLTKLFDNKEVVILKVLK